MSVIIADLLPPDMIRQADKGDKVYNDLNEAIRNGIRSKDWDIVEIYINALDGVKHFVMALQIVYNQ